MKVVILAAGYATRLYPLTEHRPKALLPLRQRTLLDCIVEQVEALDEVQEVTLVSNAPFYEQFLEWKQDYEQRGRLRVQVLNDGTTQATTRLGAIGDLQLALEQIGLEEEVLVLASDNLFDYKLSDILAHYRQTACENLILAQSMDDPEEIKRFAVAEVDEKGCLVGLEEKPSVPKSKLAVYATYFYGKESLPLVKRYLDEGGNPDSPGNFPAWLYRHRPVQVYVFEGRCMDVGTKEAYAALLEELENCPSYEDSLAGR